MARLDRRKAFLDDFRQFWINVLYETDEKTRTIPFFELEEDFVKEALQIPEVLKRNGLQKAIECFDDVKSHFQNKRAAFVRRNLRKRLEEGFQNMRDAEYPQDLIDRASAEFWYFDDFVSEKFFVVEEAVKLYHETISVYNGCHAEYQERSGHLTSRTRQARILKRQAEIAERERLEQQKREEELVLENRSDQELATDIEIIILQTS